MWVTYRPIQPRGDQRDDLCPGRGHDDRDRAGGAGARSDGEREQRANHGKEEHISAPPSPDRGQGGKTLFRKRLSGCRPHDFGEPDRQGRGQRQNDV